MRFGSRQFIRANIETATNGFGQSSGVVEAGAVEVSGAGVEVELGPEVEPGVGHGGGAAQAESAEGLQCIDIAFDPSAAGIGGAAWIGGIDELRIDA